MVTMEHMDPHERAIGVEEVAAMLGVSRDTVYAHARAGDLPGFKVGRLWRFWPSEVRASTAPRPVDDPWAMPPASLRARRLRP